MEMKELNFSNMDDFNRVILDRYHQLNDVCDYLNAEGKGELEALKAIYYHSCFARDLRDFISMEEFLDLTKVEGKSSSYYKTINRVKVAIKRIIV